MSFFYKSLNKSLNNKSLPKVNIKTILTNKYLLYLIALIAFLNVIGFLINNEITTVVFFFLIGSIIYTKNKNMTVVLGLSLISVMILKCLQKMLKLKEGFKEGNDHTNSDSDIEQDIQDALDEALAKGENDEDEDDDDDEDNDEDEDEDDEDDVIDIVENLNKNKNKNKNKKNTVLNPKSGFENQMKLKPSLYNMPNKKQLSKQLGKADKMEKAYDNLEKVIGENNINSMSKSTKELVEQQKNLLKGLKEITPALNEAMGAIGKIDLGNLSNMFKNTQKE